jgi:hypothetical protein
LLLLAIGAAVTVWGLVYEIWPLERARQEVADFSLDLQRLDNQLIEFRQIDADFLQTETYELLESFVTTTVQDASLRTVMLQNRGERLFRPLLSMFMHTVDTTSLDKEAVDAAFRSESARIQGFVDELKKGGMPSVEFQSYVKSLRSKFLVKLTQSIAAMALAIDRRETSRKNQDHYSLWSGVLKAIGFVLLLLSTLVGLKLIERKFESPVPDRLPPVRPPALPPSEQ